MPSPAPQQSGSYPIDATYARRLQCTRQWRGFLAALGQEFAEALPPRELHALMARIGTRFAVQQNLGNCETIAALQDAMNQVWEGLDWGFAELAQTPAGMEVHHRFSPLAAAFGNSEEGWATGFLQGVYQQWFEAAGAGGLRVQVTAPLDTLGSARLRLATA